MSDKLLEINNANLTQPYIKENNRPIVYTAKEVASILKTNVDYIHQLRKAGILKFIKLGQYKVRQETLISFLEKYDGFDLTNPFYVKEMNNESN